MTWIKNLAAPKYWPYREGKYRINSGSSAHNKDAMPLAVLVRDYFGFAKTLKEVKSLLNRNLIKVNGKIIHNYKLSIGLMDVFEIGDDIYIILPVNKRLIPVKQDKYIKLSRIENKTSVKGGKTQLNFHDGRNILVEKDEYKTGDVIVHNGSEILEKITLEKGNIALIVYGSNIGNVGIIEKIDVKHDLNPAYVYVKINNKLVQVPKDYIFMIGHDKPLIKLGDES